MQTYGSVRSDHRQGKINACRSIARVILRFGCSLQLDDVQDLENSPNKSSMSHFKMELTDGWYGIPATIDSAMANLIAFGKVREGTKLITSRAELLNCDQGCSPLEVNSLISRH